MKQIVFTIMFLILVAGTLFPQKLSKASSPAVLSGWNNIDVNSVNATISFDGVFGDYRKTQSSAVVWPKGTNKTAIFTSGLWIIGKHRPTDSLRTAVMNYNSEYQPGKIISTFNTTTNASSAADDPAKPEYRLYKITRGMNNFDHNNWPAHLGAPFKDVNNNGVWDTGIDDPLRWGDQQLWTVSNDANVSKHPSSGATNPLGIELQSTFFSFAAPGAAENTVFMRYKFINKSDADYDSVYVSYWSDTDMGNANDDVAGVDTIRKMSYIYNGDNDDQGENGYGTKPPATGFILVQGPMVFTGNTSDTARIEGKIKIGYKNLHPSSHAVYEGGGTWNDPPLGQQTYAIRAFNYQRGFIGYSGAPYIDPQTNQPSKFVFPGDPVTNTGWTQDKSFINPGDMRSMLSTGPISLAKGDTQEVVFAFSIAQSTDRLASITLLRSYADQIHNAFRNNFAPFILQIQKPRFYFEPNVPLLNFAKVDVGNTSDTTSFYIGNLGKDTLVINTSSFTNGSFIKTSPVENTIKVAGGTSAELKIIFKPLASGIVKDSLTLTTNDTLNPKLVLAVIGNGAQIVPVISGSLYSADFSKLYTVSSSNGAANLITSFESGTAVNSFAVRPSTKELISIGGGKLFRISSNIASSFPSSFTFSGYNLTGGASFFNDSLLMFSADSIIGRININTGIIDTVHRFLQAYSVRAMSYHASTHEIYFSIRTQLNKPDTSDALYKINISSKNISRVGRVKIGFFIRSLLFDKNGKLYGLVDSSVGNSSYLVSINTSNGSGTMIGSTGVNGLIALAMDPNSVANAGNYDNTIPEKFVLEQNYPNPFNPSTTIHYSIPIRSQVTLSIFNVLGQRVTTLTNDVHDAGNYSVAWNGKDNFGKSVASGLYFYHIRADDFSSAKKMILMK